MPLAVDLLDLPVRVLFAPRTGAAISSFLSPHLLRYQEVLPLYFLSRYVRQLQPLPDHPGYDRAALPEAKEAADTVMHGLTRFRV